MPKVTFEFKIGPGEEDEDAYHTCYNADKYRRTLWEMAEFLRAKCKYGDDKQVSWEALRTLFYRTLADQNLSGEDL
jgi:hypothetical protein